MVQPETLSHPMLVACPPAAHPGETPHNLICNTRLLVYLHSGGIALLLVNQHSCTTEYVF